MKANFYFGPDTAELIMTIALDRIRVHHSLSKAIETITKTIGCPVEMAEKILSGEMVMTYEVPTQTMIVDEAEVQQYPFSRMEMLLIVDECLKSSQAVIQKTKSVTDIIDNFSEFELNIEAIRTADWVSKLLIKQLDEEQQRRGIQDRV